MYTIGWSHTGLNPHGGLQWLTFLNVYWNSNNVYIWPLLFGTATEWISASCKKWCGRNVVGWYVRVDCEFGFAKKYWVCGVEYVFFGNLQCNLMKSFIKQICKSPDPYSNQVGFPPNKCKRARRPCANPRLCWSALQNVIGKGRYLVAKRGFDFRGGQGFWLDWSLAVDTLLFARVGESVMLLDILMFCLALGCGCSKTTVVATQAEPSAQTRAPTNNIFWMHWPESLAQISTNWNIRCEWIQTQLVQTHFFLEGILRQYSHHYITVLVGKTRCATCTVKAGRINFG